MAVKFLFYAGKGKICDQKRKRKEEIALKINLSMGIFQISSFSSYSNMNMS